MIYNLGPYRYKNGLIYKRGFILFKPISQKFYSYFEAVSQINFLCGIQEQNSHVKTTKSEFNMTFIEAMRCLESNKCKIQGDSFRNNNMLINDNGVIKIENSYCEPIHMVMKTHYLNQMYRKVCF